MTLIKTKFNMIGNDQKTYFVADIAANHDGNLKRAKDLINMAADAGANAAKFQNFKAETIVSRKGFHDLGKKIAHQNTWKDEVYEVYNNAELPLEWTEELIESCVQNKIDYFTAAYDLQYIDYFEDKMEIYKIGSGDITWRESLIKIADKNKPAFIATGASDMLEVRAAMKIFEENNTPTCLMQCNTNYTGEAINSKYLNLNVLKCYAEEYPNVILGLSDHTDGHLSVLGAVSLGARVIEKHFTDDRTRIGPDHKFSLDQKMWKSMVDEVRELELMLGDGVKKVEQNELDSQVVQRRALRFNKQKSKGEKIGTEDLIALRPCPEGGLNPFQTSRIIGRKLTRDVNFDDMVKEEFLEQ